MSRPAIFLLLALLSAPALAYLVFLLARGLGFLDPPLSPEHELRRTITLALYALLLFLSIFLFGWGRGWPRAWIVFAVVNGLALAAFAAIGVVAGARLWKLRHPEPASGQPPPEGS
ncbi:MAG: hypothetical protein ACRD00_05225 [Thermoanaerobaculia bacterium]